MTAKAGHSLPPVRGTIKEKAPFANFVWFRCGGEAEYLFRPADIADLAAFLKDLPEDVPVLPVGAGSNLIPRDGGVAGVTIRLPKTFSDITVEGNDIRAGGAAMDITISNAARNAGLTGFEFMRGIPGSIGGGVRMNAGAYGSDISHVLVEATLVTRAGAIEVWPVERFAYAYRHSALPKGAVVVEALLRGAPGDRAMIAARMENIVREREASQPLRSRTSGSTFKNPDGHKSWQLIDAAGCRGLRVGGAEVSKKHANFLINTGTATATEIEQLGEEVRRRVFAHAGVALEWEIHRVGRFPDGAEVAPGVPETPEADGLAS